MIQYQIVPINPHAHLFEVTLTLDKVSGREVELYLPNWIPGSYMIRDFAKHIQWLKAESAGQSLAVKKLDKARWLVDSCGGDDKPIEVRYQVYAWDLSVRGAHLDQTHGFFNGTSVFLAVKGQEEVQYKVNIQPPAGEAFKNWRVATGLQPVDGTKEFGFGWYQAENYDELIDCPVEMSDFRLISFDACGVPHYMALTGQHKVDEARLKNDLIKICEHHIRFFGEPAPVERYIFMTYVLGKGFGGLEHRNSTALHCSREDLPLPSDDPEKVKDSYQTFLDLCSHEYFHTWNVKRIKPAEFLPYDTQNESHTELLWAFEGFTSYYDNLALVQTGIIPIKQYLLTIAKTITTVQRARGRLIQSVTDSSFDAWTKFYKQDENAPNAVVSYYSKGALIALCMDLLIRKLTDNQKSLRDVMVRLWQEFGQPQIGVKNDSIQTITIEVCGQQHQKELDDFFQLALYSTDDLPLVELLKTVDMELVFQPRNDRNDKGQVKDEMPHNKPKPSLGIEYQGANLGITVKSVYWDSAACEAGISAGDQLISMNDLKIDNDEFAKRLAECEIGETVVIRGFRRDELMRFEVTLKASVADTAYLVYCNDEKDESSKLKQWLTH
ncbi:peptidase M61 [Kangiella profundi]|uniref:Peptidase M61 n=1 Tax=Kangiella profundi TaxID=1561924 RepID=A0A2K9ARY1_9GAMM|nr:PDZ domain-containing protein [Kangiella profundi]AUD79173.1 peptidase M61 [Kangiella profundi]GGF00889.1 peptidase [Kangiella profundi]